MACWSLTTRACNAGFLLALAVALALAGCRSEPLPVYSTVPGFTLISQDGSQFRGSSLTGNVWIAELFFTHCTGPCPRMNARFRQIDKTFSTRTDFKLVSLTVDPARDNAEVLAEYARRFNAEPGRWYFLTGPIEQLNELGRNVFLLSTVDGSLDHSTRFVLVDRKRRIRGFYGSSDQEAMDALVRDVRRLLKDKT